MIDRNIDGTKEMLHTVVMDAQGNVMNSNFIPMTEPKNMVLPKADVTFSLASNANPDGSINITTATDKLAVYVTLTTLAQGRFSDNAFVQTPGSRTIRFLPIEAGAHFDIDELAATMRVEHVA